MDSAAKPATTSKKARFVTGSTMRHILVMTSAMGVGLLTIFLVDLVDVFFLSLLNDHEIMAALGFAGPILFFTLSICVGSSIAMSALVSRHVGAGDEDEARHFASNIFVYGMLVTGALSLLIWLLVPHLLALMGAAGDTHGHAVTYLRIILPSMPVLSVAMAAGAVLRAVGDPKRSALAMLAGSVLNAVLDPIFIFGLDMDIAGAATASVLARVLSAAVGLYWIGRSHRFLAGLSRDVFRRQLGAYLGIALPAILTNVATPVGHVIVVASLAVYGDSIMSGAAVAWRLVPVAFFGLFALSGALGPIFGQNFGARRLDRVRDTLNNAIRFVVVYVIIVAVLLFVLQDWIIAAFQVTGDGATIMSFYMTYIAVFFMFDGAMFATNAGFNNLGHPRLSTAFNWAKATLGTIPFVLVGGMLWGPKGIFVGVAAGGVLFGAIAVGTCYRIIGRLVTPATTPPARSR